MDRSERRSSDAGESAGGCPVQFEKLSLLDPAVQQCPYPYYDWLRRNDPVHWDEALQCFVVSTDALVREAALNWQQFSNVGSRDFGSRSAAAGEADRIRSATYKTSPLTVAQDPPVHTQYRKIMNHALSRKRMRDSKPRVEELAAGLLSRMIEKGGGDFVEEFCIPLPFAVIADLLGLPSTMHPRLRAWADSYTEQFKGSISPEREIECAHTYVEYHHFFEDLILDRRKMSDPPDDLVTAVALARLDDGSLLDMASMLSLIEQFIIAGAETTTNALSMGGQALAGDPALLAGLRGNAKAVERFSEEILRLYAPAQGLLRIVQEDCVLGGVRIPAGAKVMLRWGAANTDETVFPDAQAIDVTRANAHRHVTFGHGIHKCQGAPLARIELVAVFGCMAEMIDRLAIDLDGVVERVPGMLFMGLKRLPLKMTARSA